MPLSHQEQGTGSTGAAPALTLGTSLRTGTGKGQVGMWACGGAGLWGAVAWPCCGLARAGVGGPALTRVPGPRGGQGQAGLAVPSGP